MIRQTLTRITASTFLAGVATLGVVAPANAQEPSHPDGPGTVQAPGPSVDQGWEASQLAAGALGGILVAGGAIAIGAGIRRHHAAAHTF
jgi:hypothetical protein